MKKLVSGLAILLVSAGLAACGSSNDPATNAVVGNDTIGDETVLNDELPADANLTITDNAVLGNELDPGNAATTNAL